MSKSSTHLSCFFKTGESEWERANEGVYEKERERERERAYACVSANVSQGSVTSGNTIICMLHNSKGSPKSDPDIETRFTRKCQNCISWKKPKKKVTEKFSKKFPNGAKWAKKRNNEFSATWHLSNFCQLDVSTEKNLLQLLVKFLNWRKCFTVFIV